MVWGYVYRVHAQDRQHLQERENGCEEIPKLTVYLLPPNKEDDPSPVHAFTFTALKECPKRCGTPADYFDLIIKGAKERNLPREYQQQLSDLLKEFSN